MVKNVVALAAAAGLALSPIAAQAGTRASDSQVSFASLEGADRVASPIGESENIEEFSWLLVLLLGGGGFVIHEIVTSRGFVD